MACLAGLLLVQGARAEDNQVEAMPSVAASDAAKIPAKRFFSLELGSASILHSTGITNTPVWGGRVGGTYGFKVLDRGKHFTTLSFLCAYEYLLDSKNAMTVTGFVYGLEFGHMLFADKKFSLHVGYGLLINMVGLASEKGTTYGHHTMLTIGTVWKTGQRTRLGLDLGYNMISFPNFNREKRLYGYGSIAVRMSFG